MKEKFKKTVGVYERPEGGSGIRTAMILLSIVLVILGIVLMFL